MNDFYVGHGIRFSDDDNAEVIPEPMALVVDVPPDLKRDSVLALDIVAWVIEGDCLKYETLKHRQLCGCGEWSGEVPVEIVRTSDGQGFAFET